MSKSVKDAFFNPEYNNEGYEIGFEQGKSNKDKNRKAARKALHPVNRLIHTDHALETLHDGQDNGYIDGKRVQNNIFGGIQPGVSKVQSYQYHVNLLEDAISKLLALRKKILAGKSEYKDQISRSNEAGFNSDYVSVLREKYQFFCNKIDELDDLLASHQATLEEHQDRLQHLIRMSEQW